MKTVRIRKNAKKQIASLLVNATKFSKETYSMRIDDCMESNGSVSISREEFNEWFIAEYSDMRIHATYNDDGELIEVRFNGEYYFSDEVLVTFEKEEKKPVFTFDEVTEALENGYVSPLNSDEKKEEANVLPFPTKVVIEPTTDADKDIVSVFVDMAEGRTIDAHSGETLSIADYENLASIQALASNLSESDGYDKTFIIVNLRDGRELKFRHDITLRTKSLIAEWSKFVDYVRKGKTA